MTGAVRSDLVAELAAIGDLVVDPEIVESYRFDRAATGFLPAGRPLAVARPRSAAEVQAIVRAAREHGVPVVPRGAGSGLSGGANAIDGGIVVCTERMTEIAELDAGAMTATVEAGVLNATLKQAAARESLWYAPDPASYEFSTLGGNVATNAGGLCCVKHGVTRDALLGLEVVLADGRLVRLGRRTRKGVTGYDLAALFCGSEGTLGIITSATLRLVPKPGIQATFTASFDTLAQAGHAVAAIMRRITPSLLELMDAAAIGAVQAFKPMGFEDPPAALLFGQADELAQVELMASLCEAAGADLVVTSDNEVEGGMLLAARRLNYPALEHTGKSLLIDDVCVPISRLADMLARLPEIAEAHDVTVATVGHAGDGNLHPVVMYEDRDEDERRRAQRAFGAIIEEALALGGTITGEHGVGTLKRGHLDAELGESLDLHRAIKRTLDPGGLMNPGKAI